MIHPKILLDTDYEVTSEVVDIVDKGPGKGCLIVNRMCGYLINEKGERDLAYVT